MSEPGAAITACATCLISKKANELSQQMGELAAKLGPEYIALVGGLQHMDPNSKDSKEIESTLDAFDKLCAK